MNRVREVSSLLYVPLGIAIIQSLYDSFSIVSNYVLSPKNPLIPDYLMHYASFPRFILLGIYLILGMLSYYLLRKKTSSKILVIVLFALSIALVLFKSHLIIFFHTFNPYG